METKLYLGDARFHLKKIEPASFQTCITSPPYFGLRDYGERGQIGLENSVEEYVHELVQVFKEVRRTLTPDGTLWLNLGDCYNKKQLVGVPWKVAFALQEDGWFLRSDIVWSKSNPMPENVTDRPTRSHEFLFLLSPSAKYFYDHEAIKEPTVKDVGSEKIRFGGTKYGDDKNQIQTTRTGNVYKQTGLRNKRDVWTIGAQSFKGAHFAVMPKLLVEPCVLAGSRPGDTVLDPFAGSGTVGVVALNHGRNFTGIELSESYLNIMHNRIYNDAPSINKIELI